jgi:hypothetical protein
MKFLKSTEGTHINENNNPTIQKNAKHRQKDFRTKGAFRYQTIESLSPIHFTTTVATTTNKNVKSNNAK